MKQPQHATQRQAIDQLDRCPSRISDNIGMTVDRYVEIVEVGIITLSVEIGEDHRLVIELPPDTPVGTAQVTIYPQSAASVSEMPSSTSPAREAARAILLAANALNTTYQVPDDVPLPSPEEFKRISALFSQGRTSDEIIDEDRGSY